MTTKRNEQERKQSRWSATPASAAPRRTSTPARNRGGERGHTLVEVVVAMCILAISSTAFYAGLSSGFGVTQASREDVRATQILMQQLEAVRLCTWSQLTNYTFQQV